MNPDWTQLLDMRFVIGLLLPLATGIATLVDPNPRRARVWFYAGCLTILAGIVWLTTRRG